MTRRDWLVVAALVVGLVVLVASWPGPWGW